MKKKWKIRHIVILFLLIFVIAYVIYGFCDTKLTLTLYDYHNTKLPEEFNGFKIIQISDLHHKNFGKNQEQLIDMIRKEKPDIILLTGDIADEEHTNMKPIEDMLVGICDIASVYYVSGNHELYNKAKKQYDKLEELFDEYGVMDIDDETVEIEKGNASIYLHGEKYRNKSIAKHMEYVDESKFNILMYHCSDAFDLINNFGYDIIFSGHTHGGVVKLPFIGGLVGNGGELFPKYDSGAFIHEKCTMFSSSGLGDTKFPRFNNPPEVLSVTLYSK